MELLFSHFSLYANLPFKGLELKQKHRQKREGSGGGGCKGEKRYKKVAVN